MISLCFFLLVRFLMGILWLVDLWCLMPLSIIFQLYWWRKPEYLEKTMNLLRKQCRLEVAQKRMNDRQKIRGLIERFGKLVREFLVHNTKLAGYKSWVMKLRIPLCIQICVLQTWYFFRSILSKNILVMYCGKEIEGIML